MRRLLPVILFLLGIVVSAHGQFGSTTVVKNGNDFLSIGADARALGMGGAYSAYAYDVTAAYWNPALLSEVQDIEVAYMHSERFAGIVNYDYAAVALPVPESEGVVAISFFRQSVDDIPNTTNAWDLNRGLPVADPNSAITRFSAYDMAFFLTYSSFTKNNMRWGITAKILNSEIGNFADAWGYSFDVGISETRGSFTWAIALLDAIGMTKYWNVNSNAFQDRQANFNEEIPEGQNERTPPSVRIGLAKEFSFGKDLDLATTFDTDIRFEGREAFYINTGKISYEPKFGTELGYKQMVFLRLGANNFFYRNDETLTFSPTFGAGFQFKFIELDYSFDNFYGVSSDLGNTHRVSVRFNLGDKLIK